MHKKNILKTVALVLVAFTVTVGCKKVSTPEPLGTQGQNIIKFYEGFPDTAEQKNSAYKLINLELLPTPQSFDMVELRRDVANNAELNKPLTVTVENDPGAVSDYDSADPLVSLPSGTFEAVAPTVMVGNSYTVTFEPGEFSKTIRVKVLNAGALDLSSRNGLGFRITSISGEGRIAAMESSFVVEVGLKNKWDGIYSIVGDFVHPTACLVGPFFTPTTGGPREISLISVSANVVKRELGGRENLTVWNGCTGNGTYFTAVVPRYQINSDNTVTILDGPGSTVVWNYYTPTTSYDPATKTFNLHYGYSNTRIINEKMTYLRSR